MKLLNALLATAVLLSACQAEQDGELQISGSKSDFSQTSISNSTNGVAFPSLMLRWHLAQTQRKPCGKYCKR